MQQLMGKYFCQKWLAATHCILIYKIVDSQTVACDKELIPDGSHSASHSSIAWSIQSMFEVKEFQYTYNILKKEAGPCRAYIKQLETCRREKNTK